MSCAGCSTGGSPNGCGNKGHCSSGGCNKMNTFDWLSQMELHDPTEFNLVEVSFKQGARKDFFKINNLHEASTGDTVVVDANPGYDIGHITLSGELVRLQMKKKRVPKDREFNSLVRVANTRDLEKLTDARSREKNALVRSRAISRSLGLEMKVGDVEYQGDLRKATFYYTAEGRVDFRELVRSYAREFKVKVEMRQIGSRQESARIGGIGSCGRELCCSTWLSDFKSVSTTAARYQNIAINQTKLSGQCGRLKCCLNYELDTYMRELDTFPKDIDSLRTKKGRAHKIKMDIFKGLIYYGYDDPSLRGPRIALDKERVREIKEMNKKGEFPAELQSKKVIAYETAKASEEIQFADVTGEIELPNHKKRKSRNKRNKRKPQNKQSGGNAENRAKGDNSKGGQSKSINQQRNQQRSKNKKGQDKPNPNQNKERNKPNPNQNKPNPNQNKPNPNQNKSDQTQKPKSAENSADKPKSKNKRNWRGKNRNNKKDNTTEKKD